MHDNLGQVASLIKINLHTILLTTALRQRKKLEDTRELTKQLITDIKSLSVSLGADRISQTGACKSVGNRNRAHQQNGTIYRQI
jgi:hypothetical protein